MSNEQIFTKDAAYDLTHCRNLAFNTHNRYKQKFTNVSLVIFITQEVEQISLNKVEEFLTNTLNRLSLCRSFDRLQVKNVLIENLRPISNSMSLHMSVTSNLH